MTDQDKGQSTNELVPDSDTKWFRPPVLPDMPHPTDIVITNDMIEADKSRILEIP